MSVRSYPWIRLACLACASALLGACAFSGGDVRPLGPDNYEVSYNSGLRNTSWVELKNITLKAAEDHCTSLGQKLVDPRLTSNGATGLIPKKATTRLTCAPVKPAR